MTRWQPLDKSNRFRLTKSAISAIECAAWKWMAELPVTPNDALTGDRLAPPVPQGTGKFLCQQPHQAGRHHWVWQRPDTQWRNKDQEGDRGGKAPLHGASVAEDQQPHRYFTCGGRDTYRRWCGPLPRFLKTIRRRESREHRYRGRQIALGPQHSAAG
jgi:hypothetical protein